MDGYCWGLFHWLSFHMTVQKDRDIIFEWLHSVFYVGAGKAFRLPWFIPTVGVF